MTRSVSHDELELLVSGGHGDPHAVLGAHPHDGGVTVRVLRPMASSVEIRHGDERHRVDPRARGGVGRRAARHRRPRLPGDGGVRRRAVDLRRPLPLPAHPRRGGPPPHQRGPAREAVDRSRRPRPHLRERRHRHLVRGLGAQRPGRAAHRRLQQLGRPTAPDAPARHLRRVGAVHSRRRQGHPLQVRAARQGRGLAREGGPAGPGHRGAAGHVVGRVGVGVHLGRRGLARHPRGDGGPGQPDVRLRGAPGLVATRARLRPDRRPAGRPRAAPRLHPRRVPAGDGAPVRRVLGLPGHLLLRADRAVRRPRRAAAC